MELTVPHPIHLADPHTGIVPSKYISIKRTQACACCNRVHEWCELYAYSEMKSTLGFKRVENLRKLDWPKYRLPIEQWEDTKCHILPFCHDCNEPSLMNSRDMLDPPPPVRLHIVGTPQSPKPADDRIQAPKTPTPKAEKRSVDALMDLIS